MILTQVGFHPDAEAEAVAAAEWYGARSAEAAAAFRVEIERAVARIAEAPVRWPVHVGNTRRLLLRRFPFFVVYRPRGDGLEIIAVAHARRLPGYWRHR